jgi:hypothetical protein
MKTEPQRPGSVPVSKEVEEIVRQRLAEPGDEKGKPWSEVKYVFVRIKHPRAHGQRCLAFSKS